MQELQELDEIILLLNEWKNFKAQKGEGLREFGKWLTENKSSEQVPLGHSIEGIPTDDFALLGRLWGRMGRFSYFLTKKALQGLPLKSFDDFGILVYVSIKINPKKSDIIKYSLLETSTCFEIIKRLVRAGLLQEQHSAQDRRSIQVQLSDEGKKVLQKALIRAYQMSKILAADLNAEKRAVFVDILKQLDKFHGFVHEFYPDESLENTLARLPQNA